MLGWDSEVQMNVLITNVPGPDREPFPAADELENSLELVFNIGADHDSTPEPWCPHQVVLTEVKTVV